MLIGLREPTLLKEGWFQQLWAQRACTEVGHGPHPGVTGVTGVTGPCLPRLAAGPVAGTAALLTRRRRVQGTRTHGQVRTRGPSLPPRALMSRRRGMTHTSRRPASARGEAAQTPRPEASAASSAHDRTPSTRPQEQVARAQSMPPARERGSGGPCWPSFQGLPQLHEVTVTDEPLARQGGPYAECNRLCEATCFTPPPPRGLRDSSP